MRAGCAIAILVLAMAGCTLHSDLPDMGTVPPFHLTAQSGAEFSSESLRGKVWVADFIFTTCNGPCPRMSALMERLQDRLASSNDTGAVRLVSITVDPQHDTPPVLAEYSGHFHARDGFWLFLTGPVERVQDLTVNVFHINTAMSRLEHSTRFVLVDGKGRIRGYYETADTTALDQIVFDIGKLKSEVF